MKNKSCRTSASKKKVHGHKYSYKLPCWVVGLILGDHKADTFCKCGEVKPNV